MSSINISQPDVTLLMDLNGLIRDVNFSSAMLGESSDAWLGRQWVETVAAPGHEIVRRMIDDALAAGVSTFSHVLQRLPSGREVPVEYTTLMLGGKAGLIAIGKSVQAVAELQSRLLAAQQAMERDFWKLREVETRYRLLFEASDEAVLLVRDANLRIVEANSSAILALGLSAQGSQNIVGVEMARSLEEKDRKALQSLIARAEDQGKAPAIVVRLGPARTSWRVRASRVMSEPGPLYLLQLTPATSTPEPVFEPQAVPVDAVADCMPDGFVVVDADGHVLRANSAFLDLVQAGVQSAVVGARMSRWLCQPGADWSALSETLDRHRTVRTFATRLSDELGGERAVEIAAGRSNLPSRFIGIHMRDMERYARLDESRTGLSLLTEAIEQKLGKAPLKEILDEAMGAIERQCIETALRMTHGNRKAAAEFLGLSRQTLYAKLGRYDLGKSDPDFPQDGD